MSVPTQNPPLLLTKRLTGFLQSNRNANIPTLLITSPTGKLLAHASPQPVSLLRTHATVAASLFAIHTSSSSALSSALPGAESPPQREASGSDEHEHDEETEDEGDGGDVKTPVRATIKPSTITVQLTGGTVLIRRLKCGLLFVCVGPSAAPTSGTSADAMSAANISTDTLRPPQIENGDTNLLTAGGGMNISTSPSDVESLISVGAQTTASLESQGATAVVAMRRHAADLARWLDDKLGMLAVPDDGVGGE